MGRATGELAAPPTTSIFSTIRSRIIDRFLEALLLGLTRWAEAVPIERSLSLGASVGRSWARFGLPRVKRVHDQLGRAFPDVPESQRELWKLGVFEHFGRSLAELILLRGRHREELLARVDVVGLEHLASVDGLSTTGGALLVTAHYGNWELGGARIGSLGVPLAAVFRGRSQPVLDRALREVRSPANVASVDYQQIRMGRAGIGMIRALRQGRKVLVLLDQDAGGDAGLFVSFFGRPARVRTGPLRLALRTGVPIVPIFVRRDREGSRHSIRVHPPFSIPEQLPDRASSEVDEALIGSIAQQMTKLIEDEIREDPAQWIWTHRRWRTQPSESDAKPGRS